MSVTERSALLEAFDSNWVAPVGPHLAAFEQAVAERCGVAHAVALSSGTAALHLALLTSGVGPKDEVITASFTFAATANAITYCGAVPVFVDSDESSWNLDPVLVAEAIDDATCRGVRVGAIVTVDLFGQCADHDAIRQLAAAHQIPIVEDAAEALGASSNGRPAGSLGDCGVLSFNGNKIMTTAGGGMLVTNDKEQAERCRHLATQARQPTRHYEHHEVGYNYRMSNILAALGVGQIERLDHFISARAKNRQFYEDALRDCRGVTFNPIGPDQSPNHWLTVMVLSGEAERSPDHVIDALEAVDVEARRAWKPMHLQQIYQDHRMFGGAVCERVFNEAVCLPSGSALTDADRQRVVDAVRKVLR